MKTESEWPWIARIARDLGLHSEDTIRVALKAQQQDPLRPLDSFLSFGEAARETVADYLDQDRLRYVGAVEDRAFAQWGLSEEQFDEASLERARLAQRRQPEDTRLWSVFQREQGLGSVKPEPKPTVRFECPLCGISFEVKASLFPFVSACPSCGALRPERAPPSEPRPCGQGELDRTHAFRVIGPYTLLHQLRREVMGPVYLGEDAQGNRVALKTLGSALSEEGERARFEHEGRALTELRHPNIVSILSSGIDEQTDRPYMALELVEGRDLGAMLRDRPERCLTLEETVFTIEHVSRALIHAHSQGVTHRNVRPQSVVVTIDGRVKLTDFGVAVAEAGSAPSASKRERSRCLEFAAPETIEGGAWSPAADIYALGVLAFYALRGETPFEADSATALRDLKGSAQAPRLRDGIPEVPAPFSELIASMLDRSPQARPTAEAFAQRLSDCAQDTMRPAALRRLFKEAAEGLGTVSPSGEINRVVRLDKGQVFHHCEVEEEVGRGGMGVVYKAHHMGLDRTVALKILVAGTLASDDERRRFLREAQAAGGLQHKNVVPILDAGEHEGTYFLTMEHVQGEPMGLYAARIEDAKALLRMFCQICDGVAHAHSRGVIHRDLKPENVLVQPDGTPRILDFGIAKRLDEQEGSKDAALTSEGDILGTVRYMPPEQAAGEINQVDVRSDVYALGSMLFELVAGQTPFGGSIREILHQIHFVEPQPPSAIDRGLPWELDAICLKALEKDRDDRYQSALELKQDVERYLDGLPIRARRATPWYRLKKWALRNKRSAAGIVAGSCVVMALLVGLVWTLVVSESHRRQQILDSTSQGWRQFAAHDFQAALDEFNTAIRVCSPDDVLPMSPQGLSLLPAAIRRELHEEERAAPRVTKPRLRAWAAVARHRLDNDKVRELVVKAREQFDAGRLRRASETLLLGKTIAPDHLGLIKLSREVAQDLVRIGKTCLISQSDANTFDQRRENLERARDAIEEARRLDEGSPEVLEAAFAVAGELGKLTELEQAAALHTQNLARSKQLTQTAAVDLLSGDLEGARRGFEQALAFDGTSKDAREGLFEVERKLAERLRADELRETLAKVDRLVSEGREAFAKGALDAARTRFIQALAFDGGSVAARDGLVEVDRVVQSRARIEREAQQQRRAKQLVLQAMREHEEGRALFRSGALPEDVRERYFAAVETLKRALFTVPDYPPAQEQLNLVGREFSGVLVDQGHSELSKFILRIAGADPTEQVVVQLPHDPNLIIREENRVNIRRAFGGGIMRFAPTKAFDALRSWIKAQGARYRVVIGIRTEIKRRAIAHPQVFLKGFSIRLEDLRRSTIFPPIRLDLDGGPYERAVVVDGQGRRLMRSFDTATGFHSRDVVRRVTALVKAELLKRKAAKR